MFLKYKKTAGIVMAVFLLVLDRFLKMLALGMEGRSINLISDWLKFSLAKNQYISLSIPLGGCAVIILAFLVITGLLFYVWRRWILFGQKEITGFCLILAGAFSNLFDRIFYGYVIDYFDFKYLFVNNLADMVIFVGVAILLVVSFSQKKKIKRS